jgi:pimeloyl-ACP methyl ester carboxylesterase
VRITDFTENDVHRPDSGAVRAHSVLSCRSDTASNRLGGLERIAQRRHSHVQVGNFSDRHPRLAIESFSQRLGLCPQGKAKFAASFAADVEPQKADFMARSQVPWGLDALQGAATDPAWKSKPSFYLVATQDGMIPPPAQRMMAERAGATVREEAGSHAIYVSKPQPVADIIEAAAG